MSVICDIFLVVFNSRDREGNDSCYKPGNGHVLGHITLDCHGNNGKLTVSVVSSDLRYTYVSTLI